MRNLNKDEKKYINDQLAEKIRKVAKIHNRENLDKLVKKDVLSDPMVKDAIKFLRKTISKEFIEKFAKFEYWITYFESLVLELKKELKNL